jgi:polysaccharide pyruvyl transferase WcaK-like protein
MKPIIHSVYCGSSIVWRLSSWIKLHWTNPRCTKQMSLLNRTVRVRNVSQTHYTHEILVEYFVEYFGISWLCWSPGFFFEEAEQEPSMRWYGMSMSSLTPKGTIHVVYIFLMARSRNAAWGWSFVEFIRLNCRTRNWCRFEKFSTIWNPTYGTQ